MLKKKYYFIIISFILFIFLLSESQFIFSAEKFNIIFNANNTLIFDSSIKEKDREKFTLFYSDVVNDYYCIES